MRQTFWVMLVATIGAWGNAQTTWSQSACGTNEPVAQFGYPHDGGCQSCGTGGEIGNSRHGGAFSGVRQHHQDFLQWRQEAQVQAAKIEARNKAWPKPFDCWDRQAYFQVWTGFYDGGWIHHCTLCDAHFENANGKLNALGERKIASIMQNNPQDRRAIFVSPTNSQNTNDQRIDEVRSLVNKWYGAEAANFVAMTDQYNRPINGRRIETINTLYNTQTPPPIIQIGNQGALGSSVNSGN